MSSPFYYSFLAMFLPILIIIGFLIIVILIIVAILKPVSKKWALDLVGEECVAIEEVSPTKMGWVRVRGELWKAKSIRNVLKKGDKGIVVRVFTDYLLVDKPPIFPFQRSQYGPLYGEITKFGKYSLQMS